MEQKRKAIYRVGKQKTFPITSTWSTKGSKWHRTKSHRNEECFSQQKNNKHKPGKNHTYQVLIEINESPSKLILKGEINNHEIKYLVDTGATLNYIHTHTLEELKLEGNISFCNKTISLADGKLINSNKKIVCDATIEGIPDTIYNLEMFVIPGKANEIVLGKTFLSKNNSAIDFENGTIRIDGRLIDIPGFPIKNQLSPDEMIIETYKKVDDSLENNKIGTY